MLEFVRQHQFWIAVAAYWVFSAAVSSLPEPAGGTGSPAYLWLYRFCHTLAGNLTTAVGNKVPGGKIVVSIAIIVLLASPMACAARYAVHPGALNVTDSAAYDTLLIAETTIDQARAASQAGELPAYTKEALNTVIRYYNVTRDAWLTYRVAIAANIPADQYFRQLNKDLSDLVTAIRTLKEVQP